MEEIWHQKKTTRHIGEVGMPEEDTRINGVRCGFSEASCFARSLGPSSGRCFTLTVNQ